MNNYTEMAMRTAADLETAVLDFAHGALGLIDEVQELLDADSEENLMEELGDLLWFCALCGVAFSTDPFKTLQPGPVIDYKTYLTAIDEIQTRANMMAGLAKRWLAYDEAPRLELVEGYLWRIINLVKMVANAHGWALSDVQQANIKKLRARFPDRFERERATNRDLDAEQEVLRGEVG